MGCNCSRIWTVHANTQPLLHNVTDVVGSTSAVVVVVHPGREAIWLRFLRALRHLTLRRRLWHLLGGHLRTLRNTTHNLSVAHVAILRQRWARLGHSLQQRRLQ